MQDKLNQLVGKDFLYKGNQYRVKKVKEVRQRAVIETDKRSFVFAEAEFDDFMEEIDIRELSVFEKNTVKVVPENKVHDVEIVQSNNVAVRMIDSLMVVFDELSNSPTDETYKKAKAMVDVSGAVVNAQALQLRLKMLNR